MSEYYCPFGKWCKRAGYINDVFTGLCGVVNKKDQVYSANRHDLIILPEICKVAKKNVENNACKPGVLDTESPTDVVFVQNDGLLVRISSGDLTLLKSKKKKHI